MFDRAYERIVCDRAVVALARGEKSALSALYKRLGRQIYSVANAVLRNHHDAEDILQDTLVEIVKSAGNYSSGTNARAWALSIARNLAVSRARMRKFEADIEDFENTAEPPGDMELPLLLSDALGTLSEEERSIVGMKLEIGLSHREIASVMNLPVTTVSKKHQRAVKKLKGYLENCGVMENETDRSEKNVQSPV